MSKVSVYEQELFGATHWRVMRDDGRLIFDRHQTDFPSEQEAIAAIAGEFRRKQLGPAQVSVHCIDSQANGRRQITRSLIVNGELAPAGWQSV
jgi:hypothetical protein